MLSQSRSSSHGRLSCIMSTCQPVVGRRNPLVLKIKNIPVLLLQNRPTLSGMPFSYSISLHRREPSTMTFCNGQCHSNYRLLPLPCPALKSTKTLTSLLNFSVHFCDISKVTELCTTMYGKPRNRKTETFITI